MIKVDKNRIIVEAIALLNENGLEGVTLRKLANRLHIQAPTIYWHIKSKALLINEMADYLLQQEFGDQPLSRGIDPWHEWLLTTALRLRRAMNAYPDGASVVAGAHLSRTLAKLSESLMRGLVDDGISFAEARLLVTTIERFTFGYVIEEQNRPTPDMLREFKPEQFIEQHPTLSAAINMAADAGETADDLFEESVHRIIGQYDTTK